METLPITSLITLAFNVDTYHQSHYKLFEKVFNSTIHNKREVSYHPLLCCNTSNYTCHVLRNLFCFCFVFFFLLRNEGIQIPLQNSSSIKLFPQVYIVFSFHTHQVIIGRNPLGVALRSQLEILNLESCGDHKALGTNYPQELKYKKK